MQHSTYAILPSLFPHAIPQHQQHSSAYNKAYMFSSCLPLPSRQVTKSAVLSCNRAPVPSIRLSLPCATEWLERRLFDSVLTVLSTLFWQFCWLCSDSSVDFYSDGFADFILAFPFNAFDCCVFTSGRTVTLVCHHIMHSGLNERNFCLTVPALPSQT